MNAIKLIHTKNMSEEAWREARNQGIGGSDVSAILGINKWRTAMSIYMEKTKQWEPEDLSNNEAVHFGHKLEQVVADEFAERTGFKVQKCNYILQHPIYHFMLANLDREVIHPKRGRGVLECKTTSAWNKDEWTTDEVPPAYMVQVQHYLAVTGYDFAYIAVLIGGNSYDHWLIERDDELINMIIEKEKIFWEDHVLKGEPPALNYSTDGSDILEKLYPAEQAINDTLDMNGKRETELLNLLWANEQEIKKLSNESEAFKNELKDIMKLYERAENEFATVTWKAPKVSFTLKADDVREKYPNVWEELKKEKKNSRRFVVKYKD